MNPLSALRGRFNASSDSALRTLAGNTELKLFLEKALPLLDDNKPEIVEGLAHFLMGKVTSLPNDFLVEAKVPNLTPEAKFILSDLLRTNRYGFSEDAGKTIRKLEGLLETLWPQQDVVGLPQEGNGDNGRSEPSPSQIRQVNTLLAALEKYVANALLPFSSYKEYRKTRIANVIRNNALPQPGSELQGSILDFSTCRGKTFSALPKAVTDSIVKALGNKITSVHLPPGLVEIPEWIANLTKLELLDVPNYMGGEIDLLACSRLKMVNLSGRVVPSAVHVIEGVAVRLLPNNDEPRPPMDWKIRVHEYSDGKCERTASVLGHPYIPDGAKFSTLNYEVQFPGKKDYVVCRHLALGASLYVEYKENSDKPLSFRHWYESNFGTPEGVQKNVPFVFEKRFAEILLQAPSTYSVGYSQFGQFLKDQFDKMGKGGTDTKQLLMTTGNHALLLTLKRKVEKAEVKCVIELYDPNKTSHVRCVEASEHITNLSMANFLSVSHSDRERYLGNEQVVQCNELPEALGLNKPDQPLYDVPPKRQLTAYLGSAEERHPSRFYHLFEGGLPLDGMQKAFNECTSKREKLALLAAKNSDGIPGLCMAMQNGCTDTVKAYIAIVRQAVENQEITIVEAVELLAAKNTRGIPGLFMAMQNDHQGVVKAFIEGLRDFKLGSHLVVDLLAVKNRNGTPALDVGTEAVSAVFIEGVRMLVKDRVLSASQAAKLMS